ncbi:MAG: aldo/keto reductase [Rhodospirillaceae bacterium]|jgi:diketogulonate reductase-like aldo/keto reductase|nr:aldo/keto reductase [Rhodospirillaceae bacterium]MBT3931796.1 aldo/keto reductase [Rhodospirillaceae bacterium]MBT4771718.1 aldo/keto reductase [Rhodospirillaceae bacterium]MBT5357900.1 aldo/keto reductase [Rhodospirillaceae bacterium]MBT5768087.1 aldo/keto reductase [Rhodospirillaceae bacterium]
MSPAHTINSHGAAIPAVGYGTMLFPEPERAVELILHALNCGYRHIDTARKYGTEQWVGEGIRASGVPREEIWVTTKVTEENAKADDFARSVETSLDTLGLDYVDLLLIHWPQPNVPLAETLGALAKAKRDGLARNIGVSNFTIPLLDEAMAKCPEPLVTNQIEYHTYINQDRLIAACRKHGLLITCHAPLARGAMLDDPVILDIAAAHNKTAAQVALRWLIQQPDVGIVPRALEFSEIEENIGIYEFTLSDADMDRIGQLKARNLRVIDPEVRRPVWDEEISG